MSKPHIAIIGKFVQKLARLRGGGSALPGLVVEKIDPKFTGSVLSKLPRGIVVISGTNGKTTTTKMTVELLEGQGLKVFTNRTGSNFARGVTAALLNEVDLTGKLNADIAVLELDEAHAVKFVDSVPPNHCLLLNVMRDQLDRFGEIDNTAAMLEYIAQSTKQNVVLNREDPRITKIAQQLNPSVNVSYFGLSQKLLSHFPNDDSLHSNKTNASRQSASVTLNDFTGAEATFNLDGQTYATSLKLRGIYNIYNAAAAMALTRTIMGTDIDDEKLIQSLARVAPAFGRGETIRLNGTDIDLVLVKNPAGFRLALKSFSPKNTSTMIVINDNYADGRDMSWLWDVDFSSLAEDGVDMVSGVRAYDMALRLDYDDITIRKIEVDLASALDDFVSQNHLPKRIYCTYTAMLKIRKLLSKKTNLEKVL